MQEVQDYWLNKYREKGAFWLHDGNPKRPHTLLTSGKHSNGFFDSELVMEDTLLLGEACFNLVELLVKQGLELESVDRVVGPAMGAITFAHEISRNIGCERGYTCLRAYTEKLEVNHTGQIIMVFKRTAIRPLERILPCEDVLTTGDSVGLMTMTIASSGGVILPFVVTLVNRSGLKEVGGKKIVALIDYPMPMWTPPIEECPLCKQGSEAIHPKEVKNWARLNASY
ncbi:MAG: phosphoribosyltransferase family protein [Patescibacteria group bacterium]